MPNERSGNGIRQRTTPRAHLWGSDFAVTHPSERLVVWGPPAKPRLSDAVSTLSTAATVCPIHLTALPIAVDSRVFPTTGWAAEAIRPTRCGVANFQRAWIGLEVPGPESNRAEHSSCNSSLASSAYLRNRPQPKAHFRNGPEAPRRRPAPPAHAIPNSSRLIGHVAIATARLLPLRSIRPAL